jgi:hypothetical protein
MGTIACLPIMVPPWESRANAVDVESIIDAASQAVNDSRDSLDKIWARIFFDPSPEYLVVVWMAGILGALLIMIVAFQWVSEASKEEADPDTIKLIKLTFVWVIILLMAIQLNGKLFATFVLTEKNIANEFIKRTDEFMKSGQKYREAVALSTMGNIAAPQIKQCEGKALQEQQQCIKHAYEEQTKILKAYSKEFDDPKWVQRWNKRIEEAFKFAMDPNKSIGDKAATAFWSATSPVWEGIVFSVMAAFTQGVNFFVDVAIIFIAMVGPLAAAVSLLPTPSMSKGFVLWQVGLFSFFMYKWGLLLVNGVASDFLLMSGADVNTLWFGVVTGLIIPVTLVVGVFFGAGAIFSSLVGAAQKMGINFGGSGEKGNKDNSPSPSSVPQAQPASSQPELVH